MHTDGRGHHFTQGAVDAVADAGGLDEGFDVNIGGAGFDGFIDNQVHQFDHGSVG